MCVGEGRGGGDRFIRPFLNPPLLSSRNYYCCYYCYYYYYYYYFVIVVFHVMFYQVARNVLDYFSL